MFYIMLSSKLAAAIMILLQFIVQTGFELRKTIAPVTFFF